MIWPVRAMAHRNFSSKPKGNMVQQSIILSRYTLQIVWQVKKRLEYWERKARVCRDDELRKQALASIQAKGFHCHGGAVFALCYPEYRSLLLDLIIAYQTLCDYLDNLCDRTLFINGTVFRRLHQSLLDALRPEQELSNYYESFIFKDDDGYIEKLVYTCRACLVKLPSYSIIQPEVLKLAGLYIDLQVLKHLERNVRERSLSSWAMEHQPAYPSIQWQEFSAAAGSTLGIFALFGAATRSDIQRGYGKNIVNIFFPWVCGLHILLDYFIDQQEDRDGGDLNFVFYYKNSNEIVQRLVLFIEQSLDKCSDYAYPVFLKTVIQGLLGMYLSDPKVHEQGYSRVARILMAVSGPFTARCYGFCSVLRKIW